MSKHVSKDIQIYNRYMKRYSITTKNQGNANRNEIWHHTYSFDYYENKKDKC